MKKFLLTLLFSLIGGVAFAQTFVRGTVVDEASSPLQMVIVKVKDTGRGVATDQKGEFRIEAKEGETLEFTFLGYISQEQEIKNATRRINVALKEDAHLLSEYVVIGYGEFRREDLSSSIGEANVGDVLKASVPNITQALAGRLAGVNISSNEAQPGQEFDITIRGSSSLTQSNAPLYIVDGFPMEDFDMGSINPSDISAINVLKDASSTAIYGSRGANGVIVIETKRGVIGKTRVTYEGTYGLQRVANTMSLMSPLDFVNYHIERDVAGMTDYYLTKPNLTLDDYANMGNVDWQSKIFKTAPQTTHSVSVSGGTGGTRYTASLGMVDQTGIVINSGYTKYQTRLRLDQDVNRHLKLGVNMSYNREKNYGQLLSEQGNSANAYATYLMYRTWAYRPVMISGGELDEGLFDGDDQTSAIMNPVLSSNNEYRKNTKQSFYTNIYVDLVFLKDFRFRTTAGYNSRVYEDLEFNNSKTYRGFPSGNNIRGVNGRFNEQKRHSISNENVLTYAKTVNKFHRINVMAGMSWERLYRNRHGYTAQNVPIESLGLSGMDLGNPGTISTTIYPRTSLASFFGRVNYSYRSKYYISATFRADGSSKFSKANHWGYFPSVALSWRMEREKFMKGLKFVSGSKLRASYGVTGNNRISEEARFRTMNMGFYYSFDNGTPLVALSSMNIGNDNLKWEKTTQIDVGWDLSLFKERVSLTVDLYHKETKDLLLNASMPSTTGTTTVYQNVGRIRNQGLEISLSTVNIDTKLFTWESAFNISFNRSRVMALANNSEAIQSAVSWTADWNSTFLYLTKIGLPVSSLYGYAWDGNYQLDDFVVNADGSAGALKTNVAANGATRESIRPGDIKYVDQNRDGIVNEKDLVVIGNPIPIHMGGFNNNFRIWHFNLNVFLQWSYGNDIMNANRLMFEGNATNRNINQFASYNDRWTMDNQESKNFRIGGHGPRGVYSSRTVEDGSYLRLKTVNLSYTFPQEVVKWARHLEVYFSAQNLLTWTNYSGMDPEVSVRNSTLTPGFDYSAYPLGRTYTFGVKMTF